MTTNTTAVTNTTLPQGTAAQEPKMRTVDVGPFRLAGVKLDPGQFTEEQYQEILTWARENGAYVTEETGLLSWRTAKMRDWFLLKWS